LSVLTPTYLQTSKVSKSLGLNLNVYGGYVDVATNYTTNSAFADVYARQGIWGLFYVLVVISIAGACYAAFEKRGGMLACGSGVLLYSLAEIWRVFLFNDGIVHFLLLAVIGSYFVAKARTSAAAVGVAERLRSN
jgi:hypothetical protein